MKHSNNADAISAQRNGVSIAQAFYGLGSIASKELLHLRRDPATLVIALLIPILQLTLFGFAIDFDIRHISTVVVDMDHSQASREYIDRLRTTDYLQIVAYRSSPIEAENDMRRGDARVGVIVPPGFGRYALMTRNGIVGVSPQHTPQVRVLIDGSDSQVATRARMAFFRPSSSSHLTGETDARIDMLYNPDMRSATFMVPGLIGVIMQLVTLALTSFSLVREREQGTLEQLMVSPVGKLGLMIGKLLPYAALAMFEVCAVLLIGRYVFDVHIAGSVALLLLLSLPFLVASLALGLLISTIAQNQGQALQLTLLITLPSILLSGFVFVRESMPGVIYLMSFAIPVTYYLQILRGIVVRGAGFMDVWPSVAALLVIDVLLLSIATRRFRKSVG
jgi:ABC-type multidrug transport system permease subunit